MMKSGVYQIYNPITEKRYIGSSLDIVCRLKQHRRNLIAGKHVNKHLQNAWNKYGDVLEFKPLEYCEPENLLELEQKYIDYYNSADREFGYNIDKFADHASPGFHLSEETKLKLSKAHLGKKISQETIEKVRAANIGRKKPKQSEAMKKRFAEGRSVFPRFNEVSEEKQKEWSKHIGDATRKRNSDYANRPVGFFLKVEFEDTVLYFPSLREASRNLKVDKQGIKYAISVNNGFMKKLKCKFSYITEQEFMVSEFYKLHYNKTAGEK